VFGVDRAYSFWLFWHSMHMLNMVVQFFCRLGRFNILCQIWHLDTPYIEIMRESQNTLS